MKKIAFGTTGNYLLKTIKIGRSQYSV